MVLLDMSIAPLGAGESVSPYVAECLDIIDESGLDYQLHSMGTIVEGELPVVLALMQKCIEKLAQHHDRITCSARLDYRKGPEGRLLEKIKSVEKQLGRSLSKKPS
jgi:uncharacterized protein (TIGR00106 family)